GPTTTRRPTRSPPVRTPHRRPPRPAAAAWHRDPALRRRSARVPRSAAPSPDGTVRHPPPRLATGRTSPLGNRAPRVTGTISPSGLERYVPRRRRDAGHPALAPSATTTVHRPSVGPGRRGTPSAPPPPPPPGRRPTTPGPCHSPSRGGRPVPSRRTPRSW